jgi:hypothetical protein
MRHSTTELTLRRSQKYASSRFSTFSAQANFNRHRRQKFTLTVIALAGGMAPVSFLESLFTD